MSGVKRYLVTRGSEVSEMVYASDYDRDTQALKDELDNIKRSWGLILSQRDALAAERSWAETELPRCRELAEERRIERDELRALLAALKAVPDGWRMVKVGSEGVRFGNAWISHERITGYTAEQLNSGDCHVTGRAYMEWLAAPPASDDAVSVPAAMPERWEDRLFRMHRTIQAGCWPKRWVDDAKDYELGELRTLLAQSESKRVKL